MNISADDTEPTVSQAPKCYLLITVELYILYIYSNEVIIMVIYT